MGLCVIQTVRESWLREQQRASRRQRTDMLLATVEDLLHYCDDDDEQIKAMAALALEWDVRTADLSHGVALAALEDIAKTMVSMVGWGVGY